MDEKDYEQEQRKNRVTIRYSDSEYEMLKKKYELSGCSTLSSYIRFVSLMGHIIRYTGDDIKGIRQDFHGATNNLNQIAKRVNATGVLYPDDLKEVKEKIDDIWRRLIYIQSCLRLSKQ